MSIVLSISLEPVEQLILNLTICLLFILSTIDKHNEIRIFCKKKNIAIQGNLSPQTLLQGGKKLDKEVKNILERFKDNTHIFNLSHGILPETPLANVQKVINIIRKDYEFTKKSP